MREQTTKIEWDGVDEMALALMHLTTFEERGEVRSWKGYDEGILERMFQRGWISDPSKAESVTLSQDAARRSRELFEKLFGGGGS